MPKLHPPSTVDVGNWPRCMALDNGSLPFGYPGLASQEYTKGYTMTEKIVLYPKGQA